MTILYESGTPDAVPPLAGIFGLADRLPRVLFVVIGTHADAHLALALSGPLPGVPGGNEHPDGHPRVAFVVLEPDGAFEGGSLASRVVESAAGVSREAGRPEAVFLVACRSARILGVDAAFEAEVAARRLDLPVRALVPPTKGASLSTDLEDGALRALVGLCPRRTTSELATDEPRKEGGAARKEGGGGLLGRLRRGPGGGRRAEGSGRPVVLLGGLSEARAELAGEFDRLGVEVLGGVPGDGVGTLPQVGEGVVVAPLDPYLPGACREAEERGATVVRTLFPIGVDGTARFLQDVTASAGRAASEASQARLVWEGLDVLRGRLRGRRVFFTGGTGLELPLARFLADAGAVVLEVGVPRLERKFLSAELNALGPSVDVVETPEWRAQLGRIDESRPDVVVTSPGLYNALVSRGHLCRTSADLLAAAPHGYEGARRCLALLVRTFERAAELDAVNFA